MKNFLVAAVLLLIPACSDRNDVMEDQPEAQNAERANEPRADRPVSSPSAKPVRIGEGGPRFAACQAEGRVSGNSALGLFTAPFDGAESIGDLSEGTLVHICTRSLDQRWMGVVVQPNASGDDVAAPVNCGVGTPVRSKQNYAGPCQSGWVDATYIRLVAE